MLQRKQLFFSLFFLTAFVETSSFAMDNNQDNNKASLLRKAASVGIGFGVAKVVLAYTAPYIGLAHAVTAAGISGYHTYKSVSTPLKDTATKTPAPSEEKKDK
ncbi:MAG: hypothetical protein NTX86_02770 [Candidatus Dependentiae bacterium]|nr:hypothetical protein [Candidatus Dependentiae bacterium]